MPDSLLTKEAKVETATREQLLANAFVTTSGPDGPLVIIRYLADKKTARGIAQQVRNAFDEEFYPLAVRYHIDQAPGTNYWFVDLHLCWPNGQRVPFASSQVSALGQKFKSILRENHMAICVAVS